MEILSIYSEEEDEDNDDEEFFDLTYSSESTLTQVFILLVANSPLITTGMMIGVISEKFPSSVNYSESNLRDGIPASFYAIPLGCLISGPMIDLCGRKYGLILVNLSAMVGYTSFSFGHSFIRPSHSLIALSLGLSLTPSIVYSTEIAGPWLRGYFTTGHSLFISLGLLLVELTRLWSNWHLLSLVFNGVCFTSALLMTVRLPESPFWYISRDLPVKALESLKALQGSQNHESDVKRSLAILERRTESLAVSSNVFHRLFLNLKSLGCLESAHALILLVLFFLFQQLTGTYVMRLEAGSLIKQWWPSVEPSTTKIVLIAVQLGSDLLAVLLTNKFGRYNVTIASGCGMMLATFLLGTCLYVESIGIYTSSRSVPVSMIVTFIVMSAIGFQIQPWSMMGEILPDGIRGIGAAMMTCVSFLLGFAALKLFPVIRDLFSDHGVFYFYGVVTFCSTIWLIPTLVDTQGRSLLEIQEYFVEETKSRRPSEESYNEKQQTNLSNLTNLSV